MIQAKVAIGDAFECVQGDQTLRRPPETVVIHNQDILSLMYKAPNIPVLYDSVVGVLMNSPVYMVYSSKKAYPEYLIVYK
jgi:hypothetical protein